MKKILIAVSVVMAVMMGGCLNNTDISKKITQSNGTETTTTGGITTQAAVNLIPSADFSDSTKWTSYNNAAGGTIAVTSNAGEVTITVNGIGSNAWDAAYKQADGVAVTLENGKNYKLSFRAKSTADRKIAANIQAPAPSYAVYNSTSTFALTSSDTLYETTFAMSGFVAGTQLTFQLGKIDAADAVNAAVSIKDLSLTEVQ